MTRCKGCGKEYRKGVLVFLLTPEGLKGARVCQPCARVGAIIVASTVAPVVKKAVIKSDGVEKTLRQLRTFAVAAMKAQEASGTDVDIGFHGGRVAGLESAIETIKRECGGES